jgi:hypothetical protein
MVESIQDAAPLPSSPPARDPDLTAVDAAKLYGEILAAIRTTDDTSFKLLGFVPLVSGVANGGLSLLLGKDLLEPLPVVLLAALGASLTYFLFRWEQRNVQTCSHLWKKLAFVERHLGFGDLAGRPDAPVIRGKRWGKTEAETWLYRMAGIAWLVPVLTVLTRLWTTGCLSVNG